MAYPPSDTLANHGVRADRLVQADDDSLVLWIGISKGGGIAMQQYIIQSPYSASGATTMERLLCDFFRHLDSYIIDEDAIHKLIDEARDRQNAIIEDRPRLRPVEIHRSLSSFGDNIFIQFGQCTVLLKRVAGYYKK